ncbi:Hypothetical protein NTJ_07941 [Nesidiocoris tenuis]|uniref:Uncharacterized protein n=1 Tax=Nesidiocoris tenuis TaxID=355587 RepID=A0ABN7AUS1_9HEMI|nr:Hypothetical protein NTJ_07941 [Nesidiocoris tenuis]
MQHWVWKSGKMNHRMGWEGEGTGKRKKEVTAEVKSASGSAQLQKANFPQPEDPWPAIESNEHNMDESNFLLCLHDDYGQK